MAAAAKDPNCVQPVCKSKSEMFSKFMKFKDDDKSKEKPGASSAGGPDVEH
jgi:hypothetical protein